MGFLFISGISEVHRHFIAEVLSDFLQSETSGLGEEEVNNYMGLVWIHFNFRLWGIYVSIPGRKNADQQMITR